MYIYLANKGDFDSSDFDIYPQEAERTESKVDVGRLKSPRTVRGEPSSGKELIKASSSLMNSPREPGGR